MDDRWRERCLGRLPTSEAVVDRLSLSRLYPVDNWGLLRETRKCRGRVDGQANVGGGHAVSGRSLYDALRRGFGCASERGDRNAREEASRRTSIGRPDHPAEWLATSAVLSRSYRSPSIAMWPSSTRSMTSSDRCARCACGVAHKEKIGWAKSRGKMLKIYGLHKHIAMSVLHRTEPRLRRPASREAPIHGALASG